MMTFAMVFPGQGSQSVGMLGSLADEPVVRSTFAQASEVLGFDLWALAQSGPAERLDATENTQPAMLAAAVALWRLWQQHGGAVPDAVAGHSLGEFTALVCAGALEFAEAVDLVRVRGRAMQEAVPAGAGAMAAILGLDDDKVGEACRSAEQAGLVEPVNFNAPGQVVIAGDRDAVDLAVEAAKALGAKRALRLAVSVPAHSRLMHPAAERLAVRLEATVLAAPRLTFVSAVDAEPHADPQEIRRLLVRQIENPVLWRQTVAVLVARGVNRILECGPGRVLTGLNRRIERRPELECVALEDAASIDAALAASRGSGGAPGTVPRAP
jgi:[acyl-carrier-protein] S-malonyltransferase